MNGRKAKQLRRVAEAATIGQPKVQYETEGKPAMYIPMANGKHHRAKGEARMLSKGCTRNVIQVLKGRKRLVGGAFA